MGALLCASADEFDPGAPRPALAYGLDATPVPLFSADRRCALECAPAIPTAGGMSERATTGTRRPQGPVARAGGLGPRSHGADHGLALPEKLASFPNLVIGLALGRPGTDPGGTAVRVLRGAGHGDGPRAFGRRPGLLGRIRLGFHLPARAMGFDLVLDYRVDQLGRQANSHGAVMVEGTWYCLSMPEVLVNATIDLPAGSIDASTYAARICARADFALRRKSGPDADGYERFMCPATGPRPKVRCDLCPTSLSVLGQRTVAAAPLEPPALCRQSASPSPPMSVPVTPRAWPLAPSRGPPTTPRCATPSRGGTGSPRPCPRSLGPTGSPAPAGHCRPGDLDHLSLRGRQPAKDRHPPQADGRPKSARGSKTGPASSCEPLGLSARLNPLWHRSGPPGLRASTAPGA